MFFGYPAFVGYLHIPKYPKRIHNFPRKLEKIPQNHTHSMILGLVIVLATGNLGHHFESICWRWDIFVGWCKNIFGHLPTPDPSTWVIWIANSDLWNGFGSSWYKKNTQKYGGILQWGFGPLSLDDLFQGKSKNNMDDLGVPSGKQTKSYWTWPIYSWFTYWRLWFSIDM